MKTKKYYKKKRSRGGKSLKKTINKQIIKWSKKTQEVKFWPQNAEDAVDDVGLIFPLTNVPQGDTDTSRDGDHLYALGISVNYSVNIADTYNVVRVIIFKWNQDTAAAGPSPASILDTTGFSVAPYSGYVVDNYRQKKFTILHDQVHTCTEAYPIKTKHLYRRVRSKMMFDAATTEGKGKLYIMFISDSSASTHPGVRFGSTFYFTDA